MRVLLIGSGGREHAIAWKLAQSPQKPQLFFAPGNDGMNELGTCIALAVDDAAGLTVFAVENAIDLVVIGPEIALAAGVSDTLHQAGIAVFGPSQAAAQLETSKAFAKYFMAQQQIPTARYAVFNDFQKAIKHIEGLDYPVVIKASGLAAGKGVLIPETHTEAIAVIQAILVNKEFGSAGEQIVIEERLSGPEVSLLAFSDGQHLALMPCAQDHKRLLDGDLGPNTGGMGTYSPASLLDAQQLKSIQESILLPVIQGLHGMGTPYIGVLYAGLMLTDDGPKVLEFNARFGDPETQVILPLLESDLLEILIACTQQRLDQLSIQWSQQSAVCVVLASGGYPGKSMLGNPINGLDHPVPDGYIFHAGTRWCNENFVNDGGRVLGVTCWAQNLAQAIERTYQAVQYIQFDGMQFRQDIGYKGLVDQPASAAYQAAGVNIDAGNRAVALMKAAVQSTFTPQVLSHVGSFGGLFDISTLKHENVLVASTDGVGTKVELAARLERYKGIGEDIVNHCVNDILVQGARPLFFLDYFATARLIPEVVAEIVAGMATACRENDCALLGGETAEMPGVYTEHAFDVAGTIVGVVHHTAILPHKAMIKPSDLLVGIKSSGPHTNGFSLIRQLCLDEDLLMERKDLGGSLADLLLAPHRSYYKLLYPLLGQVKGLVHITGGGFIENIPRILPDHLQVVIDRKAWPVPPLYHWLQHKGLVSDDEMYRIFNMGIGMIGIIDPAQLDMIRSQITEPAYVIGYVSEHQGQRVVLK
ncbi:MAG: phosphoribosylamine--glycine ligase [Anaerolineaceae bacterium]|nr:phosphoribosylamine--glycine ligase [Anaerolineaceae bacterium]